MAMTILIMKNKFSYAVLFCMGNNRGILDSELWGFMSRAQFSDTDVPSNVNIPKLCSVED